MTYKYLYPFRKRVEIISALYAGGFGIYILIIEALGFRSPVYWLDPGYQALLAHFMITASFVHSLGIAINGSWKYSPVLRVVGLGMHSGVMGTFTLSGDFTSASYTYFWIFVALCYGVVSAIKDYTAVLTRSV